VKSTRQQLQAEYELRIETYLYEYYLLDINDFIQDMIENCETTDEVLNQVNDIETFCEIDFANKKIKSLMEDFRLSMYETGETSAKTYQEFIEDIYATQFAFWRLVRSDKMEKVWQGIPNSGIEKITQYCFFCDGSGEGQTDGSKCGACKGEGILEIEEV